jgi:hypothetical protein
MCIIWCHGHCISTILVITWLWWQLYQTPRSIEGLVLQIKNVGVWWIKLCSSTFAWSLTIWCSIGNVQVVYENQLQGCYGTIIWIQSIDMHLEDNSCMSYLTHSFPKYFKLAKMAIVHVKKCRGWTLFLNSSIFKERASGYFWSSSTSCCWHV